MIHQRYFCVLCQIHFPGGCVLSSDCVVRRQKTQLYQYFYIKRVISRHEDFLTTLLIDPQIVMPYMKTGPVRGL